MSGDDSLPRIEDLGARLRDGAASPVDLVESCLSRIDAANARLNAFITVMADQAREAARVAERELRDRRWRGPLHGIPVAVKDFYDTAGVRTTAAFERFMNRVPSKDAAAVKRLKEAGAIIVGKTNMHTLGMGTTGLESAFGPAKNPRNEAYIPGGSSSGSAVAVAAGMCCATLDTDAIGSCRLPAACCGVVGFKGTYGLISTQGILDGEPADDAILLVAHAAITSRSPRDTALVLSVLADRDGYADLATRPRETAATTLRLGVADNFKADGDVRRAFQRAVEALARLGHHAVAASLPLETPRFGDAKAIEEGRRTIADRAFTDLDVLLSPTTAAAVPTIEAARGKPQALSPANTQFANLFGLPAVSVPCGRDANGLPIGLQIVGRPWDERTVLDLAEQYAAAYPATCP